MVHTGILDTGQASGIPIIKKLLEEAQSPNDRPVFVDCPPGSACTVMESVKDADYCILVAEPTRFGVHNLEMVYNLVRLFDRPYGVVINKCLEQENPAEKFCRENSIPIIGWIPFDAKLAALSADAKIAAFESAKYRALFTSLLAQVMKEARHAATVNP